MNEISLYDIANAFPKLMEDEELGIEEKEKIYMELTELLKQKSKSIIGYTKNIELTIEAMKNEENRIAENRKKLENKLSRFKSYVKDCMKKNNINKIETELGTLSITKNPVSTQIIDEEKIPNKYKTISTEVKIDKNSILKDFRDTGEIIEGVEFITNKTSLKIK